MSTATLTAVGAAEARATAYTAIEILRVGATTDVHLLAGATAHVLRDAGAVELQAIGAGAVNQAVKAIAITRAFLLNEGLDLTMVPAFTTVHFDGVGDVTAMRFLVELVRR